MLWDEPKIFFLERRYFFSIILSEFLKNRVALQGEKRIAKRGDPMEKKEVRREDVIEALKEIAFGRVNRGVELAYLEDPTAERIRKMDLSTVAEFKRGANGAVEIKFVDRVKALGALYEMLGGGDENEAAEFLQALEQAGEEREPWRE